MSEELELKFDPNTIEHLGIKMYSRLPYALAELVANAYDAGASRVDIVLRGEGDGKEIVVSDDGEGMSFEEIRDKFLVIGRKRRETDKSRINEKGRTITGRKGLGKLALFGIAKTIKIDTSKCGEKQQTSFVLDWDSILQESSGVYRPISEVVPKADKMEQGTVITLSNLARVTPFNLESTATSLSKMFNCFDDDFVVQVRHNNDEPIRLTRELRYESIEKQFEWNVSEVALKLNGSYAHKNDLRGHLLTSQKPIKQELRGITLYINGRLANTAGFFNYSEAGHMFAYMSGWIEADFLDELDADIISTDRQSLNWDMPEAEELQAYLHEMLRYLNKDWSKKRKEASEEKIEKRSGIRVKEWIDSVPDEMRPMLEPVLHGLLQKPQLDDEEFSTLVKQVHDLIPPYTYYHYRLLHPEIRKASEQYYKDKDFYHAFSEATKRYKNAVKEKSQVDAENERSIMTDAFGSEEKKPLKTTAKFQCRPNGQPFTDRTIKGIEDGQMHLSMGVVEGGRNVLSHEEVADLRETGLFTEKDCLDMLSILSHLFKRLDDSEKK